MSTSYRILVLTGPIPRDELARLLGQPFPDMIKFAVDVDRRWVALGGELHADAEAVLVEQGSKQSSIWGGNYFPGLGEGECIEFSSLINIRPGQGNRGLVLQSEELRARVRELVFAFVGKGEALP